MGRHTAPKETKLGKYLAIGLIAFLLIGGVYFGVTRLNNSTEESEKAAANARQTTLEKKTTDSKQATDQRDTQAESTVSSEKSTKTSEKKPAKTAAAQTKKAVVKAADNLTKSAGEVYYGVYYFKNEQTISSENSEPTIAANVIELFIMDYALAQEGGSDQVIQDKQLTEWLTPMIQQNDLTATNVLIDHYGMSNLNAYFSAQGYSDTRIEHRMIDINVPFEAADNYTSLDDCMKLLKKIYDGHEKAPQKLMLEILTGQTLRTKLPKKIPKDVTVANITGEQQKIENDIGLVLTKDEPFAIVVLTQEVSDIVKTRNAIADFSLAAASLNE
ncbi:serine hydrolase [Enterococcus pingfangensis]|uniref:serine hydrolase n=1 Tax=Enterococcus pingfangensis TaxID=2559924 RepID=UPI0010F4E893|nr:serine hydrolase [Enterococcus pingfangensis]